MNTPRRLGDLSHLERLIDRWSRSNDETPTTAGRLRRLIGISALAAMLDGLELDGEPRLAFKGGAAFELRFGARARASRDVDALVNVSIDEAFMEIAERLALGWEGFTGRARLHPGRMRRHVRRPQQASISADSSTLGELACGVGRPRRARRHALLV